MEYATNSRYSIVKNVTGSSLVRHIYGPIGHMSLTKKQRDEAPKKARHPPKVSSFGCLAFFGEIERFALCQELRGELAWRWFYQNRTVGEDDSRNTAHSSIDLHDVLGGVIILFNVDVFVGDAA